MFVIPVAGRRDVAPASGPSGGRRWPVLGSSRWWVALVAPAFADDLNADADVLTAGNQKGITLSANTGQSIAVPVDLWIDCKQRYT